MYDFMTAKNSTVANYAEGIKKVRGGHDEDGSQEGSGENDDDDGDDSKNILLWTS